MNTKFITISVMLSIVIALSGCGKKSEEAPVKKEAEMPQATKEAPAQTKEKVIKEFTDDDFIEYWAQTAYLTEKYEKEKNPIKLGEELGKLHEKYVGIEEKYSAWMVEWQQKAVSDPEKAGKQWEDIMKRMESRVAELKKGN